MIKSSVNKIKKDILKYYFKKVFLLFAIVFVLDYSIGYCLSYFYFRQESGMLYQTTYSIEKTTADILIFGSSRASHHFYPNVFEKRLNLTFYNVGRDAQLISYHYAVLKGVLKRYSPKVVILDFSYGEFRQNNYTDHGLSSLLPYYDRHPEMRSIIEQNSKFEKFKLLSHIYPYNSSMFIIAAGNAEFNKKRGGDVKGYVPYLRMWKGPMDIDSSLTKCEIDSNKVRAYESFIQDCIHSKIKLYIVCSPVYTKFIHPDYSVMIGQEIAKKNNIPFYDYSKDSVFINNVSYFADFMHMNDTGAKYFSNILIDKINNTKKNEANEIKTTFDLSNK